MPLTQRAKTLVFDNRLGVLSTHSVQYPGFPFGSSMPYAADADGSPIFFMSGLALHTQNIHSDARASLFIQEDTGSARITLIGLVQPAEAGDTSKLYLARHPEAEQWQNFADFAYYRLTPEKIYLVEGFGSMGWVAAGEYRTACLNT